MKRPTAHLTMTDSGDGKVQLALEFDPPVTPENGNDDAPYCHVLMYALVHHLEQAKATVLEWAKNPKQIP